MSSMSGNEELLKSDTFSLVNTDVNWLFRALALSISSVRLVPPTDSGGTPVATIFLIPFNKGPKFLPVCARIKVKKYS